MNNAVKFLRPLRGFVIASLLLAILGTTQSATAQLAPAKGVLLVATPQLNGSGFSESVILIIQHDDDGTVGLIVNQPTTVRPAEMLPDLSGIEQLDSSIFIGGPVATYGVIMLVRDSTKPVDAIHVFDDVYSSGDRRLLSELIGRSPADDSLRLYAGHAGWIPGQLDREIERGSWTLAAAQSAIVFAAEPSAIWRQLSRPNPSMIVRNDLPLTPY